MHLRHHRFTMNSSLLPVCIALFASLSFAADKPAADSVTLFDGKSLADWEKVDVGGSGEITLEDGQMIIAQGEGVSGTVYKKAKDLPLQNYELTLEAMRMQGSDFFCGLTFPVGDLKTCLTLVLGGWGGAVTGISSIDSMDASENNTSSFQRFADNTWYKVKLQVTPKEIHVWINGKEVINTEIEGHKLGVRPGPIESYLPLSFTTYQTTAAIKNVKLTKIKATK
jgi:hypothetical protein